MTNWNAPEADGRYPDIHLVTYLPKDPTKQEPSVSTTGQFDTFIVPCPLLTAEAQLTPSGPPFDHSVVDVRLIEQEGVARLTLAWGLAVLRATLTRSDVQALKHALDLVLAGMEEAGGE